MTTGSTIARFTITLSKSVAEPVQVAWNTKDGTAKAGVDYAEASGTAVFSPGETNKDVDVLVYGRAVGTEDRNFFLEMTPPPNAILGESIGECIIYLDTAGNTAVIQVIVPTGPQGAKGDSAYQSWLNLGNTGTEQDFIDSLNPPVEEIAAEVAPILNVGNSPLTAAGTSALSNPDSMTVSELARRVAYVGTTKVATVVLEAGDNLISTSDLYGDGIDFSSFGLAVRIMRGPSTLSPEWSLESDGRLLVKASEAGDVLYVCDYDMMSKHAFYKAVSGDGGAGLVGGLAKPVTWVGFAGGADPTGVRDSTAAFQAANATKSKIRVPKGRYKLTADVVSDPLTSWEMEMGASIPGPFRLRQAPWLAGANEQIFHYLERNSRNTCIAPVDGIGVFGTAHNLGGGTGGSAIAVGAMSYNDTVSGGKAGAWGVYSTVVRNAGAIGSTHGMEVDVANRGDEVDIHPFRMFSDGQNHAIWLASGGELAQPGENGDVPLNAVSAAIGIISNDGTPGKTARFLKGIVFEDVSLKGTDGVTGEGIAMALANRHTIQWYGPSGARLGAITSQCTDNTKAMRLNLSDFGVLFQKTNGGQTLFSVEALSGTPANFITVKAATTGNPARVSASGTDTNVSIFIEPKGAGSVNIAGNLAPQTANTNTVGTNTLPWAGGFTQTAFTVTSDERAKTVPEEITDAMLDAAAEVDWCMFQYLDRVEEKGTDGARWHFGAIAQRFVEAFERHGLDPYRFAFICYDEWADSPELIGEDGEVISPAVDAGSCYGIRYDQAIILKQKQIERDHKRQLDALAARIEEMENKS